MVIAVTAELEDMLEAAMCLWEATLDALAEMPSLQVYVEDNGYSATRQMILGHTVALETAYAYALSLGYDTCFDWEFCPFFLGMLVDNEFSVPENWPQLVKGQCDVSRPPE